MTFCLDATRHASYLRLASGGLRGMKNKKLSVLMGILVVLTGLSARSEPQASEAIRMEDAQNDPYFQIGSVKIHHDVFTKKSNPSFNPVPIAKIIENQNLKTPMTDLGGSSHLGDVISFGKDAGEAVGGDPMAIADLAVDLWNIVEDNKPVVNVETKTASALPNIAKNDWTALTGWKPEHGTTFSIDIQNLYGMNVVQMEYELNLRYGGSVKGKGQYIASAQVIPSKVSVLWAYTLNVNVDVVSVVNEGTTANPLAAITLNVSYSYGNMLSTTSGLNRYLVRGNGDIEDLDSGQKYF